MLFGHYLHSVSLLFMCCLGTCCFYAQQIIMISKDNPCYAAMMCLWLKKKYNLMTPWINIVALPLDALFVGLNKHFNFAHCTGFNQCLRMLKLVTEN